jgi:hypothetical protein
LLYFRQSPCIEMYSVLSSVVARRFIAITAYQRQIARTLCISKVHYPVRFLVIMAARKQMTAFWYIALCSLDKTAFWYIAPCSLDKLDRRLWGFYHQDAPWWWKQYATLKRLLQQNYTAIHPRRLHVRYPVHSSLPLRPICSLHIISSWRYFNIISYLQLRLLSSFLPLGHPTKILNAFLTSPMHDLCPRLLSLINCINLIIFR